MRHILLVDDDARVRETVAGVFPPSRFDVVSVSRGSDALAVLATGSFDLIVTDLFMPGENGIELITRIRRIDPFVPVVLMTGGGSIFPQGSNRLGTLAEAARIIGACHVLYKPFRRSALRKLVCEIMKDDGLFPHDTLTIDAIGHTHQQSTMN